MSARKGRDEAAAGAHELGRAMRRLYRATQRLEREALADSPVTRSQAIVMLAIGGMGQPAMTMLARELQLAPSTLTRMVDPLVDKGLIRRDASPDDRRVVVVELTASGKRMLKRIEGLLDRAYMRVAGWVVPSDQIRIQKALDGLIEAFERHQLISRADS